MSKRDKIRDRIIGSTKPFERFFDYCDKEGGELHMRVEDTVNCAIGPGKMDLSKGYENQIKGDLTVVSYRPNSPTTTVAHWSDGKHFSNTYLENVDIDEKGNLKGELGDVSGITIRSGARE